MKIPDAGRIIPGIKRTIYYRLFKIRFKKVLVSIIMIKHKTSAEKILVIGHRGAPGAAPENTVPSFVKAMELGADGIELDVSLSKDGAVMVFHNYLLNKTTDGRGLLSKRTLPELKSLDAGSFFSGEFAGTRIPVLQEVIDALDDKTLLLIEIKTGITGNRGIEKEVAALVARNDLYNRVVVSSFNPFILMRIKRADARIPVGFLHLPLLPFLMDRGSFVSAVNPEFLHPHHKKVNEEYLSRARARGCCVMAWTVNSKEDMLRMIDLGVDGIITDYPDILRGLLSGN